MGSCNCTMAALARSYQKFLRVAPQAPGLARQMSGGHGGGYAVWKKGFFFAAIPIMILGHVNAFGMADESAHQAPEFVPYDHLRIRSKVPLIGHIQHIKLVDIETLVKVIDLMHVKNSMHNVN